MKGKRHKGEGHVRQRKDGRWEAIITLPDGRPKSLYGKTEKDVLAKKRVAERELDQGLPLVTERKSVKQFLEHWLQDSVRPKAAPRTLESYAMIVSRHLVPTFGHRQLKQLSPQDVQTYLNQKLSSGLSARTVQYHRAVLRSALNRALKWGLVVRNVATLVDPPKVVRKEIEPLDVAQAEKLLDVLRGDRLEALFAAVLAVGLREGEALGLRWEDVDLETGMLRVRKQLQRIEGKLQLTDLKTGRSRRDIALPPFAVRALREHQARQLGERLLGGPDWNLLGLVFPSTVGTPMDASNLIRRYHRLLDKAGLPHKRFHDLRHTCATFLLLQGEDLRVVMEILGHSQISLTANTYQHVVQSMKQRAANRMEALLGGFFVQT